MLRTLVRSLSLVAILAGTAAAAGDPLPEEAAPKAEAQPTQPTAATKTAKKKSVRKAKKKAARKSSKKKSKKSKHAAKTAAERRPSP